MSAAILLATALAHPLVAAAPPPTATPAPPGALPVITHPQSAAEDDDEDDKDSTAADPFAVDLAVDLPIIGLTAAVALGSELIKDQIQWNGCHACDTGHLGPLDRQVLDNYNPAAVTVSDVFLYSSMGAPFVADFADVMLHRRGARSWGKDAIVLAEVMGINLALTNTIKFAVLRPRPYTYGQDGSDRDPTEGSGRLSFYSGHASTAFAMATAYGYLFQARHPRSKWVVPVWLLSYGVATTTGVMRVTGGKHFWSDVVIGAVAGSAIGLAIPALHRRRPSKRRFAGPMRLNVAAGRFGSTLALRGRF